MIRTSALTGKPTRSCLSDRLFTFRLDKQKTFLAQLLSHERQRNADRKKHGSHAGIPRNYDGQRGGRILRQVQHSAVLQRVFASGGLYHHNRKHIQISYGADAMTKKEQESFKQAALPLIKWLCENVHPHHTAIVTGTDAQLLEGSCSTGTILDYVRD